MANPSTPVRARLPALWLFDQLERFLRIEAASGIVLLVAAAAALAWANSPWRASYEALWHLPVSLGIGSLVSGESLHFWINDGLMAIFFLVVGLEIRHELHAGALSTIRQAALPAIAALGGVLAPAAIYFIANSHDPVLRNGWAVPTATDIAFAVGILALLGRRVPSQLRVLLLALAIIDDIAAIVVIALFYSSGVSMIGLGLGAAGVLLTQVFKRFGIRTAWLYVLPGALVWFGMLVAGIHPAIAGVIMGLLTPVSFPKATLDPLSRAQGALHEFSVRATRGHENSQALSAPLRELRDAQVDMLPPVLRVQGALHPWVAYGIMPLFAFANAGVSLAGLDFGSPSFVSVSLGIVGGLVLGKPLGIVLATFAGVRLGICRLPEGVGRGAVLVMGCLAGIGFTMAIFISNLAFADPKVLATSKFAVLLASTVAAVAGLALGRVVLRHREASSGSTAREATE
jgi:NhaA family Na+:H+ antiporter